MALLYTAREEHILAMKTFFPFQGRQDIIHKMDVEQTHSVCKERDYSLVVA